ncbi:hypothetical protein CDCA_CDCA09G2623 [Cyanidium caldarium]|uniref:Uncharacterized protein n=1 Tax=Cyanidium caldarium TaxID=2771 RepID=A0AAV9IXS2_CYACA|nr:hypothetical protein CDCA_CDCA09G2623 [Cyanidium caldarium]
MRRLRRVQAPWHQTPMGLGAILLTTALITRLLWAYDEAHAEETARRDLEHVQALQRQRRVLTEEESRRLQELRTDMPQMAPLREARIAELKAHARENSWWRRLWQ